MRFTSGQRVVHVTRPEWGVGVVLSAQKAGDSDRLRIRFERAGMKTLVVPPAAINTMDACVEGAPDPASARIEDMDAEAVTRLMVSLPEPTRDPFTTIDARLAATLNLYRFEPAGGSLSDWAAIQSGLADPLSHFTRQKLEALFRSFAAERDAHLKRLALEARRIGSEKLAAVARAAPEAGRRALARYISV